MVVMKREVGRERIKKEKTSQIYGDRRTLDLVYYSTVCLKLM